MSIIKSSSVNDHCKSELLVKISATIDFRVILLDKPSIILNFVLKIFNLSTEEIIL